VKPSRTHSLAREGLLLIALLAVGILLVAFLHPEALDVVARSYGELALYTAGLAGVGVGGMAVRDSVTGGLTSSAGEMIARTRAPTMPTAAPGVGPGPAASPATEPSP
jgi:hypothetical protein